jgi:hypothetical protein
MMPGMLMRPPMLGMPMAPGLMMPGLMGGFNPNALPGRFGRDVLGRDFAGPGGVGKLIKGGLKSLLIELLHSGHSRVRYSHDAKG